ncbi:Retrovirus-related polyprotein from transposon [Salix suchowensis]|nr:Retrovirus-related polyprotein from transposon [Salix suchowensis]
MDRNTAANNAPALNVAATIVLPPLATAAPLAKLAIVPLVKPFPDISKIEVFSGENFRSWQERIFVVLDLHGVAWVVDPKDAENVEAWTHGNKVYRHSILSTLSNELFDVYCSYKEAREIWSNMVAKYTAKDVAKQKIVISKFYHWEMVDNKDIKAQINEYHRLLEDIKDENINLPEAFIQQLKHKHKNLVVSGATRHIYANKKFFSTYTPFKDGEEVVYLGDSRTTNVLGKGKVLLKLTSGKTLALNEVLHFPNIRANLVFVAVLGKFGIKVSFESDKIVMIENNVFVGKGYGNH